MIHPVKPGAQPGDTDRGDEHMSKGPVCLDRRLCFAREHGQCLILRSTYERGKCPFCKSKAEYLRGIKETGGEMHEKG